MRGIEPVRAHVMFIISGLEIGGAERQLVLTANALANRGWKVSVVSFLPFSDTSLRPQIDDSKVKVISLGAQGVVGKYASVVRAARLARRLRPDVVVGFMFHGIMTARVAGRLARTPAVVSSIRSELDFPKRERIMALTGRMTDAVTIMSDHLAAQVAEKGVASRSHTFVIPNAVDFNRFSADSCRSQTRENLGVTDDHFLWLAAGRLAPEKDYEGLIHAFSILAQRRETQLFIAGDGPLRDDLALQVRDLSLSDRVSLLGLRDDMPGLYRASDALVLSSEWEGMPNVVLEAMASGTPVVATAVGAVPELVSDGESGFVVPPRDHAALADAMERMMDLSCEERQALGKAGYDRARSEFSLDRVIDRWEDLFNRLLESKARCKGA